MASMTSMEPAISTKTTIAMPSIMMGGAGFSNQLTSDPEAIPIKEIVKRAFDLGIRAIDTSPYYEPSEQLLGAALSQPDIAESYPRSSYFISTKVGRIAADEFDYSPDHVRASVYRSLSRFHTDYLDVVFCHDVEYVSFDEALGAIGTLIELQRQQIIGHVGISGYHLDTLATLARMTRQRYGRPINVVQTWAQLTLQNTRLEQYGLSRLKAEGVETIYNASPLAVGLLRDQGVPVGKLGDWHPAPDGLRQRVKEAAKLTAEKGESLAALSLRFSMQRARDLSDDQTLVGTIIGVGCMSELEQNYAIAQGVEKDLLRRVIGVNGDERDGSVIEIQNVLGDWLEYDFYPHRPCRETCSLL